MASLARCLLFLAALSGLHAADPVLTVSGPEKTLTFTAPEFAALPHAEISAFDPHGNADHRYSGVAVRDILALAGAPLREKLRGRALQFVVIATSRDGYSVVYALAEFEPDFSDRSALLADAQDGMPLPENAGPLRIILPGDKKAARWARMVTSISLKSVGRTPPPANP